MAKFDIGFLGGGQLARMSIQAAQRLGLKCLVLDPDPNCPAGQITKQLEGNISDVGKLKEVFDACDRVTLENEFIPASSIEEAMAGSAATVLPSTLALANIQDKYLQRSILAANGVAGPSAVELNKSVVPGFPAVLKSRFGGYDGKGTRTVKNIDEFFALRDLWEAGGWMAEEFVEFKRELAVMVFRSPSGVGTFPTMETVQTNHVCDLVFPAKVDARAIAIQAVKAIEGFGLFGVELFELSDGTFFVNEIAPRPHNSGHYTLDWGGVSQFEQHIRMVMGWEPGRAEGADTCMANLLGQEGAQDHKKATAAALAGDPEVFVHWYGKAESRPGRKMGHINVIGADCRARAISARERFYKAWTS